MVRFISLKRQNKETDIYIFRERNRDKHKGNRQPETEKRQKTTESAEVQTTVDSR